MVGWLVRQKGGLHWQKSALWPRALALSCLQVAITGRDLASYSYTSSSKATWQDANHLEIAPGPS